MKAFGKFAIMASLSFIFTFITYEKSNKGLGLKERNCSLICFEKYDGKFLKRALSFNPSKLRVSLAFKKRSVVVTRRRECIF